MILVDAGPLIALTNRRDRSHERCVAALPHLEGPMATTWPAFGEAMHLLRRGGWTLQSRLWMLLDSGELSIRDIDSGMQERCRDLMERYCDLPMDLADATLVALAESLGIWRIFTLDAHFRVYRPRGRRSFEVLPEDA